MLEGIGYGSQDGKIQSGNVATIVMPQLSSSGGLIKVFQHVEICSHNAGSMF